jgi:hypothetical protein
VRALEDAILKAPGIAGIVLRYGRLYGPGTWNTPKARSPLHVCPAAQAALLRLSGWRAEFFAEEGRPLQPERHDLATAW